MIDQLRQDCAAFNRAHPVGTAVEFQRCPGAEWKRVIVEKPAFVLSGSSVVCFLQGVGSCFNIKFIRPVRTS